MSSCSSPPALRDNLWSTLQCGFFLQLKTREAQEYWKRGSLASPVDLLNVNVRSPALQAVLYHRIEEFSTYLDILITKHRNRVASVCSVVTPNFAYSHSLWAPCPWDAQAECWSGCPPHPGAPGNSVSSLKADFHPLSQLS